ncbi:MAG: hypothetical protein IJL07_08750 [Lachnospiraceae bacterium]|nr:hypothetical protein [Lachnospiraceae bacterium]
MRECRICEFLKVMKEINEESKISFKTRMVAMVREETYITGKRKGTYEVGFGTMRYCPECGRKLKKKETLYDVTGSEERRLEFIE